MSTNNKAVSRILVTVHITVSLAAEIGAVTAIHATDTNVSGLDSSNSNIDFSGLRSLTNNTGDSGLCSSNDDTNVSGLHNLIHAVDTALQTLTFLVFAVQTTTLAFLVFVIQTTPGRSETIIYNETMGTVNSNISIL